MLKNYQLYKKLLSAAFFACGILPIVIIAIGSIYNFKQLSINDIKMTVRQVTEHRYDVLNTFLQSQIDFLTTQITLYPIDYLKEKKNLEALFLALNRNGREREIVDLQLIDTSGKQLAYVGPFPDRTKAREYSDTPWFNEVLVRGTYVSDVFTGSQNHPQFVVALTDPLKTFVLRATINSYIFNSLLHSAQIGPSGDAFILNSNGEFQTPSLQKAPSLTDIEIRMLKQRQDTEILSDEEYFYSGRWLKDNVWLLVVKTRITDSLEQFYDYRNSIFLIIFATCNAFLLISIWISRVIVSRVEEADREQTAIDQKISHMEKMANIGRIATGIAHEINNPLQLIQMQAGWIEELLAEEPPESMVNYEEYRTAAARIKQHVDRAGTITHRLLGFSRTISTEYDVQVNELLRETLSFLDSKAKERDIPLNLELDEHLPLIRTEGTQLQQVLLNLVDNALDAVGPNGRIDIATSPADKGIRIQIGDNGPGINPEVMKKIWEPFYTTKDPGKGTGLGLSICRDIMDKLGGTIAAANKPEGGALFTLWLPLRS